MRTTDVEEIVELLNYWEINPVSIDPISSVVNRNWRIKSSHKSYILRQIAPWRVKNNQHFNQLLEKQFNTLLELSQIQSFPSVPRPLPTKSGTFKIERQDTFYWLYPEIHGTARLILRSQHIQKTTRCIAKYHKLIENGQNRDVSLLDPDYGNLNHIKNRLEEADTNVDIMPDRVNNFYHRYREQLDLKIDQFDPDLFTELMYLPLHRDLMPQNILWQGDNISGIIDFETMTRKLSTPLEDLALFALFGTNSDQSGHIDQTQIDLIYNYYISDRSETASLDIYHIYIRLIALEYIVNYLATIEQLSQHYDSQNIVRKLENLHNCTTAKLGH